MFLTHFLSCHLWKYRSNLYPRCNPYPRLNSWTVTTELQCNRGKKWQIALSCWLKTTVSNCLIGDIDISSTAWIATTVLDDPWMIRWRHETSTKNERLENNTGPDDWASSNVGEQHTCIHSDSKWLIVQCRHTVSPSPHWGEIMPIISSESGRQKTVTTQPLLDHTSAKIWIRTYSQAVCFSHIHYIYLFAFELLPYFYLKPMKSFIPI